MFISKDGVNVSREQPRLPREHYLIADLIDVVKDFMCNQPVDKRHVFRLFNEAEMLRNKWIKEVNTNGNS